MNKNKKVLKEVYDEFNVPIGNNQVIEMGGFAICLIVFVGVLFLLQFLGVDIGLKI
jgi:hypothetical protein